MCATDIRSSLKIYWKLRGWTQLQWEVEKNAIREHVARHGPRPRRLTNEGSRDECNAPFLPKVALHYLRVLKVPTVTAFHSESGLKEWMRTTPEHRSFHVSRVTSLSSCTREEMRNLILTIQAKFEAITGSSNEEASNNFSICATVLTVEESKAAEKVAKNVEQLEIEATAADVDGEDIVYESATVNNIFPLMFEDELYL